MSIAPENCLRAGLEVLYKASVAARMFGYEGAQAGLSAKSSALLADLMDAVHNIPQLLVRWEECDEELLVAMLKDYDAKWASSALADEYSRVRGGGAG
jgi:hypothetical protein